MADGVASKEMLLRSTGDALFALLEKEFQNEIPTLIKNVLKFFEYNCALILAKLDDASITSIEENIRNDISAAILLPGEKLDDYLGRFTKCQGNFKFLDGHRKWLALIAETCRRFVKDIDPPPASVPSAPSLNVPVPTENSASSNQSSHVSIVRTKKYSRDTLFRLIGAQMIIVLNDAKRITLSAWSWPSREVASQISAHFKATGTLSAKVDLLYTTPSHHADLLHCIVKTDLDRFKSVLSGSLALSLRIDGSVDRSQKHNVYVLIHAITEDGQTQTYFLGFDIPEGNSALSYQAVTQKVIGEILPWEELLSTTTSLATDGENKNTGHLGGLWKLLREAKEELNNGPFVTIWCIGHRVNLGWKATCLLSIITVLIKNVSHVASYFHQSGERTRLLAAMASEKGLNVPLHYPQQFDIRWCEFTHNLLYVFLRNWNVMIWHFKAAEEHGLTTMWLDQDRVRLVAFMCDVLTVVKIFQKTFQSNSISILQLPAKRSKLIEDLTMLKETPLENGWEQLFLKEIITSPDGTTSLRDHQFLSNSRLRSGPFSFSNSDRTLIIDNLIQNLNVYFDEDDHIQIGLAPLLELNPNVDRDLLSQCHSIIIPEMDSDVFRTEYFEAANLLRTEERNEPLQNVLKLERDSSKHFDVLKVALARACAIKPHSADVENIINVYNKYKDTDRELLSQQTLFDNIYAHTNMCDLVEFDPTSATEYWLNQKKRKPRHGTKSTEQEWFKGVFPEAQDYKRDTSRIIKF